MKKWTKLVLAGMALAIYSSWSYLPHNSNVASAVSKTHEVASTPYQVTDATFKYDFLPKEEMPILGYMAMPPANATDGDSEGRNPSFITKSNFQTYKDAGFNILSGLHEREPFSPAEVRKALQLCQDLDLAYFLNDVSYRCDSNAGTVQAGSYEYFKEMMQDEWYLYEDNFAGITVKDEPAAADFDGMANVNKALNELTDGKSIYSTLFPSYVATYRLYLENAPTDKWEAYRRYVTEYIEKLQPSMIPYNCYAFMRPGATLENTYASASQKAAARANLVDYFTSLSLFREMSQKYDLPFWVTVTSYNHRNNQQMPEKGITWTVNTSLAYGAKGLQYYTYWSHLEGNPEKWATHAKRGLVTANGTPHDTYYQIKAINENVKIVDEVLMASTNKGVIQFGKNVVPLVQKDVLYSYELLNNISGGDTFVGCFDHNGKAVYYIVNNSINAGRQTFKAEFLDKVNVRLTNSEGTTTLMDTYSAGFNLSGGQAILLEVL